MNFCTSKYLFLPQFVFRTVFQHSGDMGCKVEASGTMRYLFRDLIESDNGVMVFFTLSPSHLGVQIQYTSVQFVDICRCCSICRIMNLQLTQSEWRTVTYFWFHFAMPHSIAINYQFVILCLCCIKYYGCFSYRQHELEQQGY